MAAYHINVDRFLVLIDRVNDPIGLVYIVLIKPLVQAVEPFGDAGDSLKRLNGKIFTSDSVDLFALCRWKLFQPRAGSTRTLNRVVGAEWSFCQIAMLL